MSLKNRIAKLEAQIQPTVVTLAEAIGSAEHFAVIDGRSGMLELPDGRLLTPNEFDELAARYDEGGSIVVIIDR